MTRPIEFESFILHSYFYDTPDLNLSFNWTCNSIFSSPSQIYYHVICVPFVRLATPTGTFSIIWIFIAIESRAESFVNCWFDLTRAMWLIVKERDFWMELELRRDLCDNSFIAVKWNPNRIILEHRILARSIKELRIATALDVFNLSAARRLNERRNYRLSSMKNVHCFETSLSFHDEKLQRKANIDTGRRRQRETPREFQRNLNSFDVLFHSFIFHFPICNFLVCRTTVKRTERRLENYERLVRSE